MKKTSLFKDLDEFLFLYNDFLLNHNYVRPWQYIVNVGHHVNENGTPAIEYGIRTGARTELPYDTELCYIFKKHGSDKGGPMRQVGYSPEDEALRGKNHTFELSVFGCGGVGVDLPNHNYSRFYHHLFKAQKNSKINIFEMGIGLEHAAAYAKSGGSLRAWKEFFKNSSLYGADIDQVAVDQFKNTDVATFYCDQADRLQTLNMFEKIDKQFDLIIDDGLHTPSGAETFFDVSCAFLKKGGVYIIEDLDLSKEEYRSEYGRIMSDIKSKFNPAFVDIVKLAHYNDKDNNLMVIIN